MGRKIFGMVVGAVFLIGFFVADVGTAMGKPIDRATECVGIGGTWDGSRCRVKDPGGIWCTPGEIAVLKYAGKKWKLFKCEVSGGNQRRVVIILEDFIGGSAKVPGGSKFNYESNTCKNKCTIRSGMTSQAKAARSNLPGKFKGGAYIKILDENNNPTTGSYKICFAIKGAKNPKIYKYIGGGAWRYVGGVVNGKKICTWANSSGNFAVVDVK